MSSIKDLINNFIKLERFSFLIDRLICFYRKINIEGKFIKNTSSRLLKYISQHKLITLSMLSIIVIMPSFIKGTEVTYPEICYGKKVRVGNSFEDYPKEFGILISEEDPELSLARAGVNIGYYKEYDDEVLARLYKAKYLRLSKQQGQQAAENFAETIRKTCRRNTSFK